MSAPDRSDRAAQIVRGLAFGDALGAPASEHRTVRDPWVRGMLRQGAVDLDAARVVRPVIPFVLSAVGAAALAATDDSEAFAIAAHVLLAGPDRTLGALFDRWRGLVDRPDAWLGAAQRSALLNADAGMRPPQTGVDNPAFYDDTALPGAIAVGIAAASPADAAALARLLASITHDGVGVDAAALLARLVSALLEGTDFAPALAASRAELADEPGGEPGAGGWVGDGIRDAFAVMDAAPTPFAAVPDLIARFAPRTYSHSGIVAETLPLALAIVRATGGDHERALPLAMSISRHQDSVPALVGALCGAMGSAPDVAGLDELTGILNPATTGWSLGALARRLASQGREWRG